MQFIHQIILARSSFDNLIAPRFGVVARFVPEEGGDLIGGVGVWLGE